MNHRAALRVFLNSILFAMLSTGCLTTGGGVPAPPGPGPSLSAQLQALGNSVDFQSNQWRQAVQDVVQQLTQAGHNVIANDLDGVVTGAIQATGQTGMCGVDFLEDRVHDEIQRLVAMVNGQTPPPLPAHLCVVNPQTIDLNNPPASIPPVSISGYNLRDRTTQASDLRLRAIRHSGAPFFVNAMLAVSSPYGAVIAIDQPSGCQLFNRNVKELQLLQGSRVLSQIPVTMPVLNPTPGPQQSPPTLGPYVPPKTRGDENMNSGVFDTVVRTNFVARAQLHGNTVRANVTMDAQEWNRRTGAPDGDRTRAYGTSSWITLYTAPPGRTIRRIVSPTEDRPGPENLKGWDEKTMNRGAGLVSSYVFHVDGPGLDDAGHYVQVTVNFNPVQVELDPVNPWCGASLHP